MAETFQDFITRERERLHRVRVVEQASGRAQQARRNGKVVGGAGGGQQFSGVRSHRLLED